MSNIKSRVSQLNAQSHQSVSDTTEIISAPITSIILFSKEENNSVGLFNPIKGFVDITEGTVELMTHWANSHPDYILLVMRDHTKINDTNYYACDTGNWYNISMESMSHMFHDLNVNAEIYPQRIHKHFINRVNLAGILSYSYISDSTQAAINAAEAKSYQRSAAFHMQQQSPCF